MNARKALIAAVLVAGCDPSSTDIDRWRYPCATDSDCGAGFRCENERCTNVPADAGADAGTDAGTDAGADAGTDAGSSFDAGADAGPVDAGTDAGPLDAGTDAGPPDGGGFDAGPGNECHDGWCWVQPKPIGIEVAVMVAPGLAVAGNPGALIITDGGDFAYLPSYGEGRCQAGVRVGNEAWMLCDNGVLKVGATPQLIAAPYTTASQVFISASADGGVWLNVVGDVYRYTPPGWTRVLTPCNIFSTYVQALGPSQALLSCNEYPAVGAPYTDLYLINAPTVSRIGSFDGGLAIVGNSPDSLYGYHWEGATYDGYRVFLDGGTAPFALAIGRVLRQAGDGQLFQADTSLFRIVQSSWAITQTFPFEGGSFDLSAETGVKVQRAQLTSFGPSGQVPLSRFSVPEAKRSEAVAPFVFAGPSSTPRLAFGRSLYELDAREELVPLFDLPTAVSTAIAGLADGGFAYLEYPSRLSRYVGGNFYSTLLPMLLPSTLVPATGGRWLIEGGNEGMLLFDSDGGLRAFDAFDGGNPDRRLRAVSESQALVFAGGVLPTPAVTLDLATFATQPVPMPPDPVYDACPLGTRWFVMTSRGLQSSSDGGSWQNHGGPNSGKLVCWPETRSVFATARGQLFDADAGVWLPTRSPAGGYSMLGRDGVLWITGSGGGLVRRRP